MYEIIFEAMAFRVVRFLGKRKVGWLVEVEAQGFSILGARTSLGYFTIVVTMACRTLQHLLVSHKHGLPIDRLALLLWDSKSSEVKVMARTRRVHMRAHFAITLIGDADPAESDATEEECVDGFSPFLESCG